MFIKSVSPLSYQGMYKLIPDSGPSFYVRQEYLTSIKINEIDFTTCYDEEQTLELLNAGFVCVVELKAVTYLARCEQCRFGLAKKLMEKGFEKNHINSALNFLENKNYLNDSRFASAWLHSRKMNHYEGRIKLNLELQKRGIEKTISQNAVEEFFRENNEQEIALKAYEKLIKKGKSDEKLIAAMTNAGFSYKIIKSTKEKYEENNEA